MLKVSNLVLQRNGQKLNVPLSLSVLAGELTWLRAENGGGKSTLLKTLLGLLKPAAGEINWPQRKPSIFYLAHELAIKPQLTVAEQCRWHPAVKETSLEAVNAALKTVQLYKQKDLPCAQLSRGQQQRLALACALLSEAKLWLLDEPLTALDAQSQTIIKQLLQQHAVQQGAAIIASHTNLTDIAQQTITLEAA